MKAVAFTQSRAVDQPDALLDLELPMPQPGPRDLRVAVRAIAVNPVDTKVRATALPEPGEPRVLGYDAVAVVEAVGSEVRDFQPGDRVWYAGDISRPGSNAEYQLVDERIVSRAPTQLSDAEAAALPLTAITAWELLFDRFELDSRDTSGQSLLIVGAAGGVGSILIQLAKLRTDLKIIATASRAQSRDWALSLGADQVINHSQPLDQAWQAAGLAPADYVIGVNQTGHHFDALVELLKPQGKLAVIDDPGMLDVRAMKRKSLSLHWEFMFTRPLFETDDMIRQQQLLKEVAKLVDAGQIKTTLAEVIGPINAANLLRAHALLESKRTIGKLVLSGFAD